MKSVFELGYRYVYPSLRRELVELLYKFYDIDQVAIAEFLGLSQSAISKYLSMRRGSLISLSKFKDVREDIKVLAKKVINRELDKYGVQAELIRLSLKVLGKGYFCSYHKKLDKEINVGKCKICIILFKSFCS